MRADGSPEDDRFGDPGWHGTPFHNSQDHPRKMPEGIVPEAGYLPRFSIPLI
jgi:hypothetical protein